ncbi:MAG TPA: hypothetical protein VF811_07820 [Parasulfuritortus sp.]
MRTRPSMLRKTCPFCGGPSYAEAKLPVAANLPNVEYNLDDLGALIENQSLSLLLALVELLPYKTFACRKCQREFQMESRSTRELVRTMLADMKPVIPNPPRPKPKRASPAHPKTKPPESAPTGATKPAKPGQKDDWEAESLDTLFDYSTDPAQK